MDNISISAASGMRARMESLELLANNLANVETGGYKADREFYSVYTSAEATSDPRTGDVSTLPVIQSHWTDHSQGVLRSTGNPLDFAVDGPGLFAVDTVNGVRYTRNGNFRISKTAALATSDGNPVLGRGGSQIFLQAGLPVEVLADGTVRQGETVAGRMQIATFDPGSL